MIYFNIFIFSCTISYFNVAVRCCLVADFALLEWLTAKYMAIWKMYSK